MARALTDSPAVLKGVGPKKITGVEQIRDKYDRRSIDILSISL